MLFLWRPHSCTTPIELKRDWRMSFGYWNVSMLCFRRTWSMMSTVPSVRRTESCSPATTAPEPTTPTASTPHSKPRPEGRGTAPSARKRYWHTRLTVEEAEGSGWRQQSPKIKSIQINFQTFYRLNLVVLCSFRWWCQRSCDTVTELINSSYQ